MNDLKRGFDADDRDDKHLVLKPVMSMQKNPSINTFNKQGKGDKELENGNYKQMDIRKKDTTKIKTNTKYKCVDEGSENEHDAKQNLNEDPQQLSSKELDFRETILKHESKIASFTKINFREKKEKGKKIERKRAEEN
jgi:hypothetical protein